MHARIVRYRYKGDAHDLGRRAEEGVLPMFHGMPGFEAYSIIEADGEIISFSAWDSLEEAQTASEATAKWVADNMAGEIEVIDARFGEILFSTTLGITTKAGVTA